MAEWYVKDLSKLTRVSVQTLHHYDRIGLLKPSVRLPNGYRIYSEKDLLKLQQIISLKFFGFELAQIKTMLAEEVDVLGYFSTQSQFLEEKANMLLEASHALKTIIGSCNSDKSIPWKTVIKLIEVYHMTQQLEKTWAGKVFDKDELKEYVHFEQNVRTQFSEKELQAKHEEWDAIINQVETNLDKDPSSTFGVELGKRAMIWVNSVYGKHVNLRNAIWEKGFKAGHMEEPTFSQQGVAWLDKAISAYYRGRIMDILNQVGKQSENILLKSWNELLTDMCGDEQALKDDIFTAAMKEEMVTPAAKDWLKRIHRK